MLAGDSLEKHTCLQVARLGDPRSRGSLWPSGRAFEGDPSGGLGSRGEHGVELLKLLLEAFLPVCPGPGKRRVWMRPGGKRNWLCGGGGRAQPSVLPSEKGQPDGGYVSGVNQEDLKSKGSSQDMSITEVISSLLRVEETFSAHLARINTVVLKPLLQTGSLENIKFFPLLNDHFQVIWHLTEANYRTLKETYSTSESVDFPDIYLICKADSFLNAYIQYFFTFGTCVVVQDFEQAARSKNDIWRLQKPALQEFLADFSLDTCLAMGLHTVLQKPFRDHLQQYACVLAKLKTATGQEALCTPERRLLEDSENLHICARPGRADRVLLFNDILVLMQGNNLQSFDLKLLWIDTSYSENENCALLIVTPEDNFFLLAKAAKAKVVWQWKINRAVGQALQDKRDLPLWGDTGKGPKSDPPLCRCASFTFRTEERLRSATYEGEWCLGKPHGKGKLTWPNGQNYAGDFKKGFENGFGICLIPQESKDHYNCYKCHWRDGQMNGYGICEYGNEMVYKGYFKDNVREGFGVLDSPPSTGHPFKYTGHWKKDKKTGYGVWDDKERGERYIGMWQNDQRHGPGIVVTQSGLCFQRTFHLDKMVGSGILLLEDGSIYEGNFTNDLKFVGKGKLTFPNGFVLEDTFANKSREGCQVPGVANSSGDHQAVTRPAIQLGQEDFPVEKRWEDLYNQFLAFIRAGGQADDEESFMGFHVQTSRELRKSQENLFSHGGTEEASEKTDFLEELIKHQDPEARRNCLQQALESSLHPLGKLLKAFVLVFQSTYSGIGANKHLLRMAQEEAKHYATKIWEFYQALLQLAFKVKGFKSPQNTEMRDSDGGSVLLPLILPYFYPELLMLYMVAHEKQDEIYCQRIVSLSLLSDVTLLEYLEVQRHFWPLKDLSLSSNQRQSLVKDQCFLSATECLQKLITTVDPQEKLDILQKTYEEIEETINQLLGKEYNLPMDDFLPLLVYVVTRARIQHLGAEIHLIRDLMDPTNGGRHDFLLTALESCYQLIQEIQLPLN
ncbi:ALS2 C-terminal-like protein isoform X2 [Crotalus tigris]|uniref:ALS2 C-terminal-like protein isoform X2 n=1 Tax=Crotalus tigris TaxID=88082 RepID=UPI00192F9F08|nr:ALS2 C-terminal-like protein isoform X2 [Crotalus tigris]